MTRQELSQHAVSVHGDTEPDNVETLLAIVSALCDELHPGRKLTVTLDSALDHDLGFDSLSRAELLLRLEQAFAISLPEQVLVNAETPRDLLRAAVAAQPASEARLRHATAPKLATVEQVPAHARTLPEVLDWHVQHHPERPHIYLYEGESDTPLTITYQSLAEHADALAGGLQACGVEPQQTVALMLPTGRDYLFGFFAILRCGAVPVPIYPPARPSQLEDHLRRHAGILRNAQVTLLITVEEARPVAQLLKAQVESLRQVVTCDELLQADHALQQPVAGPDDIAFLQFTSGSTGQPKGVVLTHAHLLANIRAMGAVNRVDSSDCFVSWLPLYHDMGLIGAWLGSLYFAMPLVLMSPLSFLSHPPRWLWAIHRHRGTLSAAPNFAYELCLSKIPDAALEGLDLSSWRRAFNGAEPVSPNTLHHFTRRFAQYGFHPEALAPVYGLAEAAVGLAFPPASRGPVIDRIQRETYLTTGQAVVEPDPDQPALAFPACGQPLPGYQFRVVDRNGRELPERREGRLQFRGPSATSGYFRNPEATRRLFQDDWLDTGDLGYIATGDLYLTGRVKDMIIRGGRNIYPYEIEEAVGELSGVRKGCVAVFGTPSTETGDERLVVVAESRQKEAAGQEAIRKAVRQVTADLIALPADEVVIVPPHGVLKTSSGKIRRSAMRDLYLQGDLGRPTRALWWQLLRLNLASVRPRWHSLRRRLAELAYARYAMGMFWLLGPFVWLPVVVMPRLRWRWAWMRGGCRLLFRLVGIPVRIAGREHMPTGQLGVIVSNHASYLDVLAMIAALPDPVAFVAKEELKDKPIPRIFLQRIGAHFVERFDARQGVEDAKLLAESLRSGRSLLYFPEGTFTRSPGLLPFRMGAFLTAAENRVPVYPVIIRGTRSILREEERFPRRGSVQLLFEAPLTTEASDWAGAIELRDAARQVILRHLGEPDITRSPFQDL